MPEHKQCLQTQRARHWHNLAHFTSKALKSLGVIRKKEAVKLHPYLPDSGTDLAFIYAGVKQK